MRVIDKVWGRELIFAEGNGYTGKILEFKPYAHSSMHYHVKKHETWFIADGTCQVYFFDHTTSAEKILTLIAGDRFTNKPGHAHMVTAGALGVRIFEVSTPDDPSDTYRTVPSGCS